jgi:hypothetical protein
VRNKIFLACALGFALICFAGAVLAQSFQRTVAVTWTLPTSYDDGTPLVSTDITKVQVFLANSAIPETSTAAPTFELTGAPQSTARTFTAFAGGAIFVRLKACIGTNCSAFSPQARLDTPGPGRPGAPTNVAIVINVEAP